MGVDNGRLLAYLAAHGEILSKKYPDERVIVHCRISAQFLGPHRRGRRAVGIGTRRAGGNRRAAVG